MEWQWFVISGVNPEPWTASEGSIGKKNGKPFLHFHKPEQLRSYQESVKNLFEEQNPHAKVHSGDIELVFYFWRRLEVFSVGQGKKTRRSAQADATNLQKALEDALQGLLYVNDRDIKSIRSVIVDQSDDATPAIVIGIGEYDPDELAAIRMLLDNVMPTERDEGNDNIRSFDVESIF